MNDTPPEPSPFVSIAAFLIIAAAIVGGIVLLLATRPQPVQITIVPPVPTTTPAPSPTPAPITVYVTGAVAQPETLLTLPHDSRVQDAIQAAGGALANADLARVNAAAILHDGDQVHVLAVDEPETALATPGGGEVVYVNTATVEQLETLPDVGPTLAQAIIDYRTANGPFADMAALDAVNGIGPRLLEGLAGRVAFD
jgi:competence protein ComEA